MYCIHCGIELSNNQSICPICGTRVYHPDLSLPNGKPGYPQNDFPSEAINRKGILFVISVLFLLPLALPMIFELAVSGSVDWSGYVTGGTALVYLFFILPLWFRSPHPIIFVPCDFAAATLFIGYVAFSTKGNWFFTFALPIALALTAIFSVTTTLLVKLSRGKLYVIGAALIALGAWTVLIEWLLHLTFGVSHTVYWSTMSFLSLLILGMMFIVIAIVKPWKESLRKFFFIQ